jgi:hypothetical protein
MFGTSLSSLQASMSDLGGLAARGLQRQLIQPSFMPQTAFGMMAEFTTIFTRLADQLRKAERDTGYQAEDPDSAGSDQDRMGQAKRTKAIAAEATIILGHAIPSQDMQVFNQMVQEGYMASVSLLLEVVEASHLDDLVYQAFLRRARESQDGRIELDRDADGSEQWRISGVSTDGYYSRPLEKRRYEPEDKDSFEQLLAQMR